LLKASCQRKKKTRRLWGKRGPGTLNKPESHIGITPELLRKSNSSGRRGFETEAMLHKKKLLTNSWEGRSSMELEGPALEGKLDEMDRRRRVQLH